MKQLVNLFLSALIVTGCNFSPRHVQLANSITSPFCRELEKTQHLALIGSGGGMIENVESISLTFTSRQKVNVDQGRAMLVEIVEPLLKRVNSCPELRPYLDHFPFTADDLDISVLFQTPSGDFINEPFLASLSVYKGKASYAKYNPITGELTTIYLEPYVRPYYKTSTL